MLNFDIKNKFLSRPKNRVGLDIGSSAVKILEVETIGDKPSLAHIGLKKISDPSKETLIKSIKSLAEDLKISGKEVNISVSGPSVIVRFVSMPKMREDELKSAIKFEAEKYIPFTIEDCIIDYQILRKNEKENKFDVLLVAVKKGLVLDKIALVEESGLSVSIVDVDSFAVANSFLRNFSQHDADKTAAFLNIGSSMTNISIVRSGAIFFSRDVAMGGQDFSAAISKSLNIDSASAENMKISPGNKLQDVINCTKNMMNNLLDEIRLSFSYYENQSGRQIDEIYICGGTSSLAGIEAAFQDAFELKPFLHDPLQFLDVSKISHDAALTKNMSRSFAVATGLAIR